MKERMSDMGRVGAGITNSGGGSNGHTPIAPTTKRKELAKIAGTSEGSIKQKKLPHGVASFFVPMLPIRAAGNCCRYIQNLLYTYRKALFYA